MRSIYTKERVRSGRIPAWFLTKSSVVGLTSRCRTWGTESRKKLMKMRLKCRNIRSVLWTVEKTPAQTEVMYGKSGVIVVILKSSFFPEEQKRRIFRGYCRNDRPRNVYWVVGPV